MSVQQHAAQHQFTDGQAVLDYRMPSANVIEFTHTFVPEDRRGQGVGEGLAKAGLDYARQHQLQVIPTCPFVADYLEKHSEYADLIQH